MADRETEPTGDAGPPRAPLAPFAGARPPAPAWFDAALAMAPERMVVDSQGTPLEVLTWGEVGKPGLLLVHGNSAHADWWSFIAPFFAADYRVAAFSLPGMGRSGWRDRYLTDAFPTDAESVARAAGLYADGRPPVYVGHSYGGRLVYVAAAKRPELMRAAVIVDSALGPPPAEMLERRARRAERMRSAPPAEPRLYPTEVAALARFRLLPPQPTPNLYVVDYIGRHGVKETPEGWTWRFDPELWAKIETMDAPVAVEADPITMPIAHLYGEHSSLAAAPGPAEAALFPSQMLHVQIPDAHHHVLIDQPLALVAALRTLFAAWRA